jgi:hypothetical protein
MGSVPPKAGQNPENSYESLTGSYLSLLAGAELKSVFISHGVLLADEKEK